MADLPGPYDDYLVCPEHGTYARGLGRCLTCQIEGVETTNAESDEIGRLREEREDTPAWQIVRRRTLEKRITEMLATGTRIS